MNKFNNFILDNNSIDNNSNKQLNNSNQKYIAIIAENKTKILISKGKISKKLDIFYNPIMKLNRDISILLLNSLPNKNMQIADILAGSGIRSIRFLLELKKDKIKNISINDYKTKDFIIENLKLNNLEQKHNVFVYQKDAVKFLLESYGFDYIDIDPFGSPNNFLDASILRLSRKGILAVTATDTAALSGNSENACLRKYWAKPLKNEFMHETGIRILIRKVQLIGSQYDKALIPIFSYFKDHYYRLFFLCEKGKKKVDEILKNHKYLLYNWKTSERKIIENILAIKNIFTINKKKSKYNDFDYAGPLWIGKLWDQELVEKMYKLAIKEYKDKELLKLLSTIKEESKIDSVGFYDLHYLAKIKNIPIPKIETLLNKKASRTHFLEWGIRE